MSEIAAIPDNEEGILILRREYFYGEDEEFYESFDLVRYNLATGEEQKLVF